MHTLFSHECKFILKFKNRFWFCYFQTHVQELNLNSNKDDYYWCSQHGLWYSSI